MLIKKTKIPFASMLTIGILPSFIKKIVYRFKGYKIGKNVKIGFGSIITGKSISIKDNVSVGIGTVIRSEIIIIKSHVSIGSFTMIDTGKLIISEDARINEKVIIGGMKTHDSSLTLGKRTIVMEYSFINTTMPVEIGDDTGIGGHCLLFTHGSWLNQLDGYPVSFSSIKIGKNVWLPWRVFIMPGTVIGDNVVVGANSLVSNKIKSNTLIAGSPAKIIKDQYPKLISREDRKKIINDIFIDFEKYLKYNGFQINIYSGEILKYEIIKDNKKYLIYYLNKQKSKASYDKYSLVIYDYKQKKKIYKTNDNVMKVDLINKTRVGSTKVGEEFVKFISRYGIRFNREDY